MQEVSQETYAVQYNDFYSPQLLIHAFGMFLDFSVNRLGSDKNVIVDSSPTVSYFPHGKVDVFFCNPLGLHLVTCHDLIIIHQGYFQIAQ